MSFASLCAEHAYVCQADTSTDASGLRGLSTTASVPAGDPVLAVPWELTLTADVAPAASARHRVARHHVTVAGALLATLNLTHPDPERVRFWQQWRHALPPANEIPHPATLPEWLQLQLQDALLERQARGTRARVAAELGCSDDDDCDVAHWAMAMTLSRPFTLRAAGAGDEERPDVFAFIPFIDMTNHARDANCEVRGVGRLDAPDEYTAVELVALQDLPLGTTLSIDYGLHALPAREQFALFGFVAEQHAEDPEQADDAAIVRELEARLDGWWPPHAWRAWRTASSLLATLRVRADFMTDLDTDEALLAQYAREPPPDPRLPSIVHYRAHRKRAAARRVAEAEQLWRAAVDKATILASVAAALVGGLFALWLMRCGPLGHGVYSVGGVHA